MMKAMTELFTKNQQSTNMTLERVERSIARMIDCVEALETGVPTTDQGKHLDDTREDDHDEEEVVEEEEPFNLHHVHHHDGSTVIINRCTKSFHALRVDQISKVWETTLIMALINSTLTVMTILLVKLSL
jgi:hypothetical protein